MSSSLIVPVCKINGFVKHPNADKLRIATMEGNGWRVIVGIDEYNVGDTIVFIPVDTLLPRHLAQRINDKIENYLSWNVRYRVKQGEDNQEDMGRVKAVRLRGATSYGLIMPNFDNHPIGTNVAEYYEMAKYEEPLKCTERDALPPSHYFPEYTGIERWENFQGVIKDGTEVIITEKIHGTSVRYGYCLGKRTEDNPDGEMQPMFGSHSVRRRFSGPSDFDVKFQNRLIGKLLKPFYRYRAKKDKNTKLFLENYPVSMFEKPYHDYPQIAVMLKDMAEKHQAKSVVIYGELFGNGIQRNFDYGTPPDFRAFDISIDLNYLDYDDFLRICKDYEIPTVPELYRGPFSEEKMQELTSGQTTIDMQDAHIREGCVVKPTTETKNEWIGRVIIKSVSPEYDVKKSEKGGTEDV